jgi:hypothetical protein
MSAPRHGRSNRPPTKWVACGAEIKDKDDGLARRKPVSCSTEGPHGWQALEDRKFA